MQTVRLKHKQGACCDFEWYIIFRHIQGALHYKEHVIQVKRTTQVLLSRIPDGVTDRH